MASSINPSAVVYCQFWNAVRLERCLLKCDSRKIYKEHALEEHGSALHFGCDTMYPLPPVAVRQRTLNLRRHQVSGPSRCRRTARRAAEHQRQREDEQEALAHPGRAREKQQPVAPARG